MKHHLLFLDVKPLKAYIPLIHLDLIQQAFDVYLNFQLQTYPKPPQDITILINQITRQQKAYIHQHAVDIIAPNRMRWELVMSDITTTVIEIIEIIDQEYRDSIHRAIRYIFGDEKPVCLRYNTINQVIVLDALSNSEE